MMGVTRFVVENKKFSLIALLRACPRRCKPPSGFRAAFPHFPFLFLLDLLHHCNPQTLSKCQGQWNWNGISNLAKLLQQQGMSDNV
jgi:hypothetical protein